MTASITSDVAPKASGEAVLLPGLGRGGSEPMGVVRIDMAARAKGLAPGAAQKHWQSMHAPLVAGLPGIVSYVQNLAMPRLGGTPHLVRDDLEMFSEMEFSNAQQLALALDSDWHREMVAPSEHHCLDGSKRSFMLAHRHHVTAARSPLACKLVVLLGDGPARRQGGSFLSQERAIAQLVEGGAASVDVYTIRTGSGPVAEKVDWIISRGCKTFREALERESRLHEAAARRDGLRLCATTIIREMEIVPRPHALSVLL